MSALLYGPDGRFIGLAGDIEIQWDSLDAGVIGDVQRAFARGPELRTYTFTTTCPAEFERLTRYLLSQAFWREVPGRLCIDGREYRRRQRARRRRKR